MGDDNYIKELRQGAVGAKLPTLLDLTPPSDNNAFSRLETPTSRNYLAKDEETGRQAVRKEKSHEQIASEIAARIRQLHTEGRHLDEIYEILENEGYEYTAIEPVFMDYLNKLRPVPKTPGAPQQAGFSTVPRQAPPQQRAPVLTSAQMASRGTVPASMAPGGLKPLYSAAQNTSRPSMAPPGALNNPNFANMGEAIQNPASGAEEMPRGSQSVMAQPMQDAAFAGAPFGQKIGETDITGGSDFAPLFVKIGKYKETLENLNDLENYLKAMSRLFEVVEELEKVRVMNISAIDKMHKKALVTASKLSSGLLKPKGMSLEGSRESDVELSKLGDVINDLSKELSMLKQEVDKLNRIE